MSLIESFTLLKAKSFISDTFSRKKCYYRKLRIRLTKSDKGSDPLNI